MLLGARALQGVGAALAAPAALALLTTIFPEGPERLRAIALYTTVSAAGGAIGLVAGGILTEWTSWRWVMFVNVPIGLTVLAVGSAVLSETPGRRGRFDLPGALASTAGMTGVVLGLVQAGTSGWSAPITVVSLVGGVALLALFVHIESRAEEPILPLRILASRTRAAANAARGLGYAGMYGMVFFLTQFLQEIQHHSALVTGLGFLPTPITVFLSSQFTSRVLSGRVPAKTLMLSGSALSAVGLLLATRLHASTPYQQTLVTLVLIGAGMGISFVSLTTAGLSGVARQDAGAASGLINVSQQLGAALGLAVLVTVFESLTPGTFGGGFAGGGAHQAQLVHGLDLTFAAAAALSLAALTIVALFVRTPNQPDAVPEAQLDMEMEAAA